MEYWASDNYALFNVEVKSLKNLFHKNHGTGIIVFIIFMATGKAGFQVLMAGYKSITDDHEHIANGWRCWQCSGLEAMRDKLKQHFDILDSSNFLQQFVFILFSYSAFYAYHPHTHHHHQLFKSAKLRKSESLQMLDCKCVWLNFSFYNELESFMLILLTRSTWTRNAFEPFHKFFICKFSALLFILFLFVVLLLLFGLWILLFWKL